MSLSYNNVQKYRSVKLKNFEISCWITPLSSIGIDAPRISGKNLHGQASTLRLSHRNEPYRFVWYLASEFNYQESRQICIQQLDVKCYRAWWLKLKIIQNR
jgi:hypothetical protein